MAIKISGSSIIDDSRNIINANSVGIGTTVAQATLDILSLIHIYEPTRPY